MIEGFRRSGALKGQSLAQLGDRAILADLDLPFGAKDIGQFPV